MRTDARNFEKGAACSAGRVPMAKGAGSSAASGGGRRGALDRSAKLKRRTAKSIAAVAMPSHSSRFQSSRPVRPTAWVFLSATVQYLVTNAKVRIAERVEQGREALVLELPLDERVGDAVGGEQGQGGAERYDLAARQDRDGEEQRGHQEGVGQREDQDALADARPSAPGPSARARSRASAEPAARPGTRPAWAPPRRGSRPGSARPRSPGAASGSRRGSGTCCKRSRGWRRS